MNKKKRFDISSLLTLGFAVSGCGGGSGGSSSSSPPTDPIVPPVVPPEPKTQRSDVELHENHPLTKAVYDADPPDGATGGSFSLTQGRMDNDLFCIDADGKVWWEALPDYETPLDGTAGVDRDNIYEIEVTHTASDGAVTKTRLSVTVQNIDRELTFATQNDFDPVYKFDYDMVEDLIPDGQSYTPLLLFGRAFSMPKTGPLEVTWSIITASSPNLKSYAVGPAEIETFRQNIEIATAKFEKVINVKFIEVPDTTDSIGMVRYGRDDTTDSSEWVSFKDSENFGVGFVKIGNGAPLYTYVHETGHVMGLSHPFGGGLKSDINELLGNSIMARGLGRDHHDLAQNDINALQFLYGAPGTDFAGLESLFDTPPEVY